MPTLRTLLLIFAVLVAAMHYPARGAVIVTPGGGGGGGGSGLTAAQITNGFVQRALNGSDFNSLRTVGTNIGIAQLSPVGGNNAFVDMMKAGASFEGQLGVSYSGNREPHFWMAGNTSLTGSNLWGRPWSFPGVQSIGSASSMAETANYSSMDIYFMGSRTMMTRTNAFANGVDQSGGIRDTSVRIFGSPFTSGASLGVEAMWTNSQNGAGTAFSPVLVNSAGVTNYWERFGGLYFVSTGDALDEHTAHVVQAPGNFIIPGPSKPFSMSYNMKLDSETNGWLGQRPFFFGDNRYITNAAMPFAIRIPRAVPYSLVPTRSDWQDMAYFNLVNGDVWMTNGTVYLGNITNRVTIGGAIGGTSVGLNVNTSAKFNSPSAIGAYTNATTFGAAEQERIGFVPIIGEGMYFAHATNEPLKIGVSSVAEMHTRPQTIKKQMVFGNDGITNNDATYFLGGSNYFSGRVGIGAASQLAQLHQSNNTTLVSHRIDNTSTNSFLDFYTGNTRKFSVDTNGSIVSGVSVAQGLVIGGTTANAIASFATALGASYQLIGDTTGGGGPMEMRVGSGGTYTWRSTTRADSGSTDTAIGRFGVNSNYFGTAPGTGSIVANNAEFKGYLATFNTNAPLTFTTTGYTNTTGRNVFVALTGTDMDVLKKETNGTTLHTYATSTGNLNVALKPNQWVETAGVTTKNVEPW